MREGRNGSPDFRHLVILRYSVVAHNDVDEEPHLPEDRRFSANARLKPDRPPRRPRVVRHQAPVGDRNWSSNCLLAFRSKLSNPPVTRSYTGASRAKASS